LAGEPERAGLLEGICRIDGARLTLDIDTPLFGVETESLERALLAETLRLVDVLVSTVVSGSGVSFRVLILHHTAEGIEDSLGGEVLGGNEVDEMLLTFFLLLGVSWGGP
jgi:hypothetical protein